MKHKKMKEYMARVRKVTDEEFMEAYNLGMSDHKTGDYLGISHSRVYGKRRKFGLLANNPRRGKPNLTEEELLEAHKRHLGADSNYKARELKKKPEKYRKISRSYYHSEVQHERLKLYHNIKMGEYGKTQKFKDRVAAYEATPERRENKRIAQANWRKRQSLKD